jgi:hypothetical protein
VAQHEERAKKHEPLVTTYGVCVVASSAPPVFHLSFSSISAFGVFDTLSDVPIAGCLFLHSDKTLQEGFCWVSCFCG